MTHTISFRKRVLPVFGLMVLVACFLAAPSVAQLRTLSAPSVLESRGLANLFLSVDGDEEVDALDVVFPTGWEPVSAELIELDGLALPMTFLGAAGSSRYMLSARRPLRNGDRLILTVQSTGSLGFQRILTTPAVRVNGRLVVQEDKVRSTGIETRTPSQQKVNRSARFSGLEEDAASVRLPASLRIESDKPFLTAFWFKTTELDEVVLSTWTGVEGEPYGLEFMIDRYGHLSLFQGDGDRHIAMRSDHPIADGAWHFAAFENDPEEGWMRLSLDGIPTDSLVVDASRLTIPVSMMRLGGRLPARAEALAYRPYSGDLDEVRLIPTLPTPKEVDDIRTHSVYGDDGTSLVLDFEGERPRFVEGEWKKVDSILSFRQGPGNLRVEPEESGLRISFINRDPDVLYFLVARSMDGSDYQEIAQIRPNRTLIDESLSHLDSELPVGVVYYRVTPVYRDGMGVASPAIKAGLGVIELPESVRLLGNFPNPFNPTTTITYEVEESQLVRISVWDLSGQMISSLVDGTLPAGRFDVQFDAGTLPSGTYFVRLESSAGIQTHQMILTK